MTEPLEIVACISVTSRLFSLFYIMYFKPEGIMHVHVICI